MGPIKEGRTCVDSVTARTLSEREREKRRRKKAFIISPLGQKRDGGREGRPMMKGAAVRQYKSEHHINPTKERGLLINQFDEKLTHPFHLFP